MAEAAAGLATARPKPRCVHCGQKGLTGEFSIVGVGEKFSAVVVKIRWKDDRSTFYTLTSGQPHVQLFGSAEDNRSWFEIASAYLVLGVEHILSGYDHLLFVFGLLFLVGFHRRLVWTITAFTAAHSLTLASARTRLADACAHRRWKPPSRCRSCWSRRKR